MVAPEVEWDRPGISIPPQSFHSAGAHPAIQPPRRPAAPPPRRFGHAIDRCRTHRDVAGIEHHVRQLTPSSAQTWRARSRGAATSAAPPVRCAYSATRRSARRRRDDRAAPSDPSWCPTPFFMCRYSSDISVMVRFFMAIVASSSAMRARSVLAVCAAPSPPIMQG